MIKQFLIAIFVFCNLVSYGQRKTVYTTKNPKAIRTFENARQLYDEHQDLEAINEATKASSYDSAFVEPYFLLANIYENSGKKDKAKENYRKVVNINPDFFPKALLILGKLEFASTEYEQAQEHLQKFISHKEMTKPLLKEAALYISNCTFAIEAIKHPVPFVHQSTWETASTVDMDEYFPAITGRWQYISFYTQKIPCTETEVLQLFRKIFMSATKLMACGQKLFLSGKLIQVAMKEHLRFRLTGNICFLFLAQNMASILPETGQVMEAATSSLQRKSEINGRTRIISDQQLIQQDGKASLPFLLMAGRFTLCVLTRDIR